MRGIRWREFIPAAARPRYGEHDEALHAIAVGGAAWRNRPWSSSLRGAPRCFRSTTSPTERVALTRALASTPLTSRAAAMSSLVKDVGAVAGIASFLGLALLALLYFTQARDVRRLRERASFLVEGGTADGETVAPAERAASAVATKEPEKAAAAAAAAAPNEAEAFRRAELARQAAERRQRFEQRRRSPGGGRERPAWLSEPLSLAAVGIGAIILVGGIAFAVTRITDTGSDSTAAPSGQAKKGPCPPGQTIEVSSVAFAGLETSKIFTP